MPSQEYLTGIFSPDVKLLELNVKGVELAVLLIWLDDDDETTVEELEEREELVTLEELVVGADDAIALELEEDSEVTSVLLVTTGDSLLLPPLPPQPTNTNADTDIEKISRFIIQALNDY